MELNQVDRDCALAQKLREHYLQRLETLRRKNDADLAPEATAGLRGQIRECKVLISSLEGRPEFVTVGAQAKA